MSWLRRLAATLRMRRLDDALDDELEFHIRQRTDDLIAQGVPPSQAARAAEQLFGNRAAIREAARERDVLVWLQTAMQDFRFAARMLRRNPGFTLAAVLSLALGIGANTALFSLIDGLVLRPLPVREPGQLMRILDNGDTSFSYPPFDRLRRSTRLLSAVAAVSRYNGISTIEERGEPIPAIVSAVSANYFDMLGVPAWRGRSFHTGGEFSPAGAIAVISQSYWQDHFGAASSAIGAHFRYAERDFTIVGIAPPGFYGTNVDGPADIWVILEDTMAPGSPMWTKGRGLQLICRLKPGVTAARATAEVSALAARRAALEPGGNGFSTLRGRFFRPLVVLECLVALVLLIACANLANLMLAGAAARRPEIALRQAIGAGRARLIRQLLAESLLVSFTGTLLAFAVARSLSIAILGFLPPGSGPALVNLRFHLSLPVLAFTSALALFTCLLFGLVPAIQATGTSLSAGLKQGSHWTTRSLIAVEVAMCTLLLIGAGLFVHTLRNLRSLPTGYSGAQHILLADVSLPRHSPPGRQRQRMEALRRQAGALPGVLVAATSHIRPLSGFSINGDMTDIDVDAQHVSPGFLAAMGTPLLEGRDFSDRDTAETPPVAIVNQSFVRRYLAGQRPLGFHFGMNIIGLVEDTRWLNLRDLPQPMYYRPLAQWEGAARTLVLRTSGNLAAVAAGLARTAHDVDPSLSLADVVPFSEMEARKLIIERMVAEGASTFGALALAVACIGLYGVLAYGVARRVREIGIRMALGASRGGVQWMVLRESLLLLLAGFAIGTPAALALARYAATLLFGVSAHDLPAIAAAFVILMVVALAAAWIPARRAASVDPLVALRYE